MKKLVTTLCMVAALAVAANAAFAANAVRISQVYGGGGGSSGTYIYDFVELFNSSGSAVNIGGWSLAYGSATGTWSTSGGTAHFEFPANTMIPPCSYILVQLGSAGTAGVPFPVAADFASGALNLSASSGKVGLFTTINSNVACGAETGLVDKVAYGSSNCPEVTAAPGTGSTTSNLRALGGMTDTDNNSADFSLSLAVVPHSSGVANRNPNCLSTPSMNATWGQLKSIYR